MENTPEERRPKLSDAADAGGGEDRLSALHDDILIRILLKCGGAAAAARTSVLARRWRHLWALLPALHFFSPTDPRRIRSALAAHEAPALKKLIVVAKGASPRSAGAWLPIAARRLSGTLLFRLPRRSRAKRRAALKLPCFENATQILLRLGFQGLALPPAGVFTRLSFLSLIQVVLHGPCGLGDAVSSPRCPSLQKLVVKDSRGQGDLTIHSESLLNMELSDLPDLQSLTVVAPALEMLKLDECFVRSSRQPVANISAPRLLWLGWMDTYDQNPSILARWHTYNCLPPNILPSTERITFLHIIGMPCVFCGTLNGSTVLCIIMLAMSSEITRLPDIELLHLHIAPCGHSFGASLFHVMRMCTAIRYLYIELEVALEEEKKFVCPSDCICDHPPSWKTEELVLNCLKDVEIFGFRGTEHEIAAVNQLFSWATVLKRMTVILH